jgi:hypothetical protein
MQRLNFDGEGPSGSQEQRLALREDIDDLIKTHVEDEGAREEFCINLDKLVQACLPEPEGGLSVEGSLKGASDARIDRALNPKHSRLKRLLGGAPNPSAYVR